MNPVIDKALPLWVQPIPADDAAALVAFAEVYTDPLLVNGQPSTLIDVVQRARMLQGAFSELRPEILASADEGERCSFAFRLSGRHTGPLATPLGPVAASGRRLTLTGADVFTLRAGKVAEVWAVSDMLGLLIEAGAVNRAGTWPPGAGPS